MDQIQSPMHTIKFSTYELLPQKISGILATRLVHACSLNTQETKTENIECKGSLCYIVRLSRI